jgi:hypothetical protein
MGLGDQQPKHFGALDSKSLANQVNVWSMWYFTYVMIALFQALMVQWYLHWLSYI